ncbi:protein GPR107-like [Centruroides sculpturatus]|uniref:protein GPR107-like n=1 Tax=Centruroides sculpturatus TaxID=218467 RepID=UPI000C6DDE4C|nr:protein GPR107-like [Centruroides sculpturatus]
MATFLVVLLLGILATNIDGRKHNLTLINDNRRYFTISTFGFFKDGSLEVKVDKFMIPPTKNKEIFGFTLTRTVSDSVTPYLDTRQDRCLLKEDVMTTDNSIDLVSFIMDFANNRVTVKCSKLFSNLAIDHDPHFYKNTSSDESSRKRRSIAELTSDTYLLLRRRRSIFKRDTLGEEISTKQGTKTETGEKSTQDDSSKSTIEKTKNENLNTAETKEDKKSTTQAEPVVDTCSSKIIPLYKNQIDKASEQFYTFEFRVTINDDKYEGLYSLYFHNCANEGEFNEIVTAVNLSLSIIEENNNNYLSAGEIPLPRLYFTMSFVFFLTGCAWIYVLRMKKQESFKIHYLMGLLVFVKSLSLVFHGINYHFIAKDGSPMEAWAVLYYITHLLKGALLFITIVLIGTGWAFIKHILSDKDKKIFMIVIPLQVLANVAEIIMEESEEGETQHTTWREVFILVDLLCCGAILFPVVWSIRHLQEASQTDGKAAINLEKLKLFRHFYVMIVCYIYFTRIIVYLLKITVPFQYEWLDELFREVATLIFFVLTGYNFRPTTSNPYFRLSQDDYEIQMDEVITQTGLTEGVVKTRSRGNNAEESITATTKRESSHEYD